MHYSFSRIISLLSEIGILICIIGNNKLDSNNNLIVPKYNNGRILNTTILDTRFLNVSTQIVNWVNNNNRSVNNKTNDVIVSHHWWRSELPINIQTSFDSITQNVKITEMYHSLFWPNDYAVEELTDMNELYVTGQERANENMNSDHVFYTPHLDGPFYFLPFTSVYRSIIGLNNNNKIVTYFPTSKTRIQVETGDVLAFDFNREIHYIYNQNKDLPVDSLDSLDTLDTLDSKPRITIKAHYCIYPKYMSWFGKHMCALNVHYNRLFRFLFLKTITPTNQLELLFGKLVVFGTNIYVYIDMWIGYNNIALFGYLCYLHP
jgi:hypothetical protein